MNTKTKVAATVVVFALLGFMLGPQAPLGSMIWPANEHVEELFGAPTSGQIGLLMTYGALASVTFGFGVAFILFGFPLVRNAPVSPALARLAHVAISWLLVSWVPHDALHQHIGSMGALIGLEYGFHLTLQIGGLVLAWFFVETLRGARHATATARPVPPVAAK